VANKVLPIILTDSTSGGGRHHVSDTATRQRRQRQRRRAAAGVQGVLHGERKAPDARAGHATVAQARKESSSAYKPALAARLPGIADYDTVFLGFPIWGETLPPVLRAFLAEHDLSGKTLIPFVTHGGYGLGNSLSVLASDAPKARLLDGFAMEADQERRTMERVTGWLENAG
jgi:hypothetical protein